MYLKEFILAHEDWEQLLKNDPYNLIISRDNGYILFKYTQFASDFSNPAVRESRGIIFRESDWKCVCHPFDKFGNYGESYCSDIDWNFASVQEKIDGSLIKIWNDGTWNISTNGTIDAFKAKLSDIKYDNFGQVVIDAIHKSFEDEHEFFASLDPDYVYMFELVSQSTRVVIPYNETKLYFLGLRNMITDEEIMPDNHELSKYFDIPRRYPLHSLEDVKNAAEQLNWDEEGYVVCDNHFNRVKIKSPEYVKAHYIRNNNAISTEHLVDIILNGEQEEFLIYASDYKEELESIEDIIHQIAITAVESMHHLFGDIEYENRGEYASKVKMMPNYMKSFMFNCYDEKLFFDYASKKWTSKNWVSAIEEFKKNE